MVVFFIVMTTMFLTNFLTTWILVEFGNIIKEIANSKSKELRDAQKKILKEEVSEENVNRERQISESEKNGIKNKGALKEAHNKNISELDL